jgi:hypothetical protein
MAESTIETNITAGSGPSPAGIIRSAQLIKAFSRNFCPNCRSENLLIKGINGPERLMILLTGKRKYRCKDCGLGFRMPDRRRSARAEDPLVDALPGAFQAR